MPVVIDLHLSRLRERSPSASSAGEGAFDTARINVSFTISRKIRGMSRGQARYFRRNPTNVEALVWRMLRDRRLAGCKFRRQHPIGPFIADFACIEHRLVLELDGGQHADSKHDEWRTAWLDARGWRVVRFWNNDVLGNPSGVIETILGEIALVTTGSALHPHPPR